MTAHSPRSDVESASSTTDPDAQARRANDGQPSAGFPSDLTIDEDAVHGLFTAEDFAAAFDEHLDDGKLYAEYRRLAAEQAALRRVATLVAGGVEPMQVFGAVAEEMRRCVPVDTAALWRFESDREITLVAAAGDPEAQARWPVGTRTTVDGNSLAALMHRQRPARTDRQLRQHRRGDRCPRARGGGSNSEDLAIPVVESARRSYRRKVDG